MANRSTLHVKDVSDATKELIRRYRIKYQVNSGRAVDEIVAAGVAVLEQADNSPMVFGEETNIVLCNEEKPRE